MKKVLAIAITVMMLLTMAVVMPVSADTATEVNLIKNGSFEMDADGDTDLDYWTQLNENVKMKAWKITDFRYNPPTDGVNVAYAKLAGTEFGISQVVDLTDTEYYTNQAEYGFVLTFESYKGSGYESKLMYSMVTMTTADGQSVSEKYTHTFKDENLAGGTNGGVFTNTFDATGLLGKLNAPAKTITVTMQTSCELSVDNIKLTPVKLDPNLIKNGSFEMDTDPTPNGGSPSAGADSDLEYWTQMNESAKVVVWATAPNTPYNPATDGINVAYKQAANVGIYQIVDLSETPEYYTNQAKYDFTLYVDTYRGGSSVSSTVTVTSDSGESAEATFTHSYATDKNLKARMFRNTFNITELVDSLSSATKTIKITMQSPGELCVDNIKLVPTYNANKPAKPINIPIVNASFEADPTNTEVTATTGLTGWTADEGTTKWVVKESDGTYLIPTSGSKMIYYPKGAANTSLRQEIAIPKDADYYANVIDYNFKLTYSAYYIGLVDIVVKNYDKTAIASTTFSNYGIGHTYKTVEFSFDVTEAMLKVGKPAYVELVLRANSTDHESGFDNISLKAIKKAPVTDAAQSLLLNGDFEVAEEDGTVSNWTPQYDAETNLYEFVNNVDIAPGGYNCVKLVSGEVDGAVKGGILYQDIAVEEGKWYKISFKYRTPDSSALVDVSYTSDWSQIYSRIFAESDGNDKVIDWSAASWLDASAIFKSTRTATMRVALRCYPGREGVCYENVSLTEWEVDESKLTQAGNLLVNGSFEEEALGAYGFIGWDETGSASSITVEEARARDGVKVMKHGFDTVSQKVAITDYDNINNKNYGYSLDFSYGSYNGGNLTVKFELVFEDETQNQTVQFDDFRALAAGGATNAPDGITNDKGEVADPLKHFPHKVLNATPADISIDITAYTTKTTSPLKSINIIMPPCGTACYLDDFKLYKNNNENTIEILDADGNAVVDVVDATGVSYTAKAKYYGAVDAMAYIAVYTKDSNGILRLSKVTSAAIAKGVGVENSEATLDNVDTVDGTTIVKAFLWNEDMVSVAGKSIE
ncbi:MAG: hypothetical protein IKV89_02325 [Clostridia bacterium]|nr:hypothetical protein [Clostridia bacterium]